MNKPFVLRGPRLVLPALAVAFAACVSVAFADDKPASETKPAEEKKVSVDVGGVKVAIDPATGKFRPLTAEEAQQIGAAMRQKLAEIRARAAAKRGGEPAEAARATSVNRSVVVGLSHLKYSVLSVAPDGTSEFRCLTLSEKPAPEAAAAKDRE